jgi:signal transduction histidine kinase
MPARKKKAGRAARAIVRRAPDTQQSKSVALARQLAEARAHQAATADILRAIASSPDDVQPVLEVIAKCAARLCEAKDVIVLLREGDALRYRVHRGDIGTAVPLGEAKQISRDWSAGRCAADGRQLHVHDILADPDGFPEGARMGKRAGYRTVLMTPLLRDGVVLGVIGMRRTEVRPFETRQIELINTFADQAVIAIENVRLFNETKEALERQTATSDVLRTISRSTFDLNAVLQVLTENATRLAGAHQGFIFRFDGEFARLAYSYNAPPEYRALIEARPLGPGRGSLVGRVLLERRPVHLPDVLADSEFVLHDAQQVGGFRSMLGVPMLREGNLIGVIAVWATEVRPFTDKQIELVSTFADQAVIAIENVRLFNETKDALERQTATAEILKVISNSPSDLQPVFDAVLKNATSLCDASLGLLLLREGSKFKTVASIGTTAQHRKNIDARGWYDAPPSTSLARSAQTRQPIQTPDLRESDGYRNRAPQTVDLVELAGARSYLQVPMVREDEVVGSIGIFRSEVRPFTQAQIDLVSTFANQAVIAIQNVRLFNETKDALEQQTATAEILKVISESPTDTRPVFDAIVQSGLKLFPDAVVLLGIPQGGKVHAAAIAHADPQVVQTMSSRFPIPLLRDRMHAAAILDGEFINIPDAEKESDGRYAAGIRNFLASGFRAITVAPMMCGDSAIGAISVTRPRPGPLSVKQFTLLRTFAAQAVIAVENVRVFKELEARTGQLEVASRHKSDFLASMSHELRTPLNAILGFNEMILSEVYGAVPGDMQEPLKDIQTSGKHLLRLINNVLDLAKIEAGRMELALSDYSVQDTVESVRATLRPLAAEKGLEFLAQVPADLPLAHGDAGRITQCLLNLAGNSLKFTKQGKVEIAVVQRDGLLRYSVSDTGIGIPPDKIGSLFTEFKQTDATIASEYGGTGLGLSISKKFVEMQGGRIWVESEVGRGSTFIFEIPIRVAA